MNDPFPITEPEDEIIHIGRLHFLVKSEKGGHYTVDLEEHICSCEAFQIRKLRPCKHYSKIAEYVAEAVTSFSQSSGRVRRDNSGMLGAPLKTD